MRKLYLMAIMAFALINKATAQIQGEINGQDILDLKEDTSVVTTLDDILTMQEGIQSLSSGEKKIHSVWERNKYRNFSYNTLKMKSAGEVPYETLRTQDAEEGTTDNLRSKRLEFKSDWGASITLGTNYRLHKPIANMVSIGLDYTWFDLNLHHFEVEKDGAGNESRYNSADLNETFHFMPWEQEKYEAEFGMMLGPSVTIAPFITTNSNALAHLRLQVYYHIGYRLSLALIRDKNNGHDDNTDSEFSELIGEEWGHGIYSAFGINLSWKAIGFGYEANSGNIKYKSLDDDNFGKDKTEFKLTTSRIYLQIRF